MQDYRQYGALALAYMGDAVYETFIRKYLMQQANMPVKKLHMLAKDFVSAAAQSRFVDIIEPMLSEDELSFYKRGRNSKPHTTPKNAQLADYKKATGLETLIGYLYLSGNMARINELMEIIFENSDIGKTNKKD